MISGIIASPGYAFGKALLFKKSKFIINNSKISINEVSLEIKKFLAARNKSILQLKSIKNIALKKIDSTKSSIFEGHIMLLMDKEFEYDILTLIKDNFFCVELAVNTVINFQIKSLENLKDEYLKDRKLDIIDIGERLLNNILNLSTKNINFKLLKRKFIIVSADLTPSQIIQLNLSNVIGIITNFGGRTSHTSIIAKHFEIPYIIEVNNATKLIANNDYVILDAINNSIYINPKIKKINNIKLFKFKYNKKKNSLNDLKYLESITLDKYKVKLYANINLKEDLINVKKYGADGIGLYRTEFLFMNRNSFPSENEQFILYKKIALSTNNKVIIRTIDIGSDKNIPYINQIKEDNPFLGCRGIRFSLDYKKILHIQLKAILRASFFGKLYILHPMITSLEEIYLLNNELKYVKDILYNENKNFNKNIKIGIMIETPSAAIISHHLAKVVDFFSIGTNDLIQYTLAVDRNNRLVSHLYDPFAPAVLFLIKMVITAAHKENKLVGICGELASNKKALLILIGLNIDELSISASLIPYIKKIIRNINFKDVKLLANKILLQSTSKDIINIIDDFINKNYKFIFKH